MFQFDSILIYTATTYNVKISVSSEFEHAMSDPEEQSYIFSYKILIENLGDEPVHLLERQWYVIDSLGVNTEVHGDGVVGEKPIILPGEAYEYSSWCQLSTDAGKMFGYYVMKTLNDGKHVDVRIPEFLLLPTFKLN
ncbi:MAG: Co2+/Mg2+ efflux protein ApaG [Bacteroidia bacterium]|nr:Co2+/Mg2+ efflux protein ApaG [Bacteroidia bacterium]